MRTRAYVYAGAHIRIGNIYNLKKMIMQIIENIRSTHLRYKISFFVSCTFYVRKCVRYVFVCVCDRVFKRGIAQIISL